MQNCPQAVISLFAILRANAVVVPVNPMNRAEELAHCIADSEAKLAIVSSDLSRILVGANEGLVDTERLAASSR